MSRGDAHIPRALPWGKRPFLRKIAIPHFTDEDTTRQSLCLAGTQLDLPSLTPKSKRWEAACQGIDQGFSPRATHQLEGSEGTSTLQVPAQGVPAILWLLRSRASEL